MKINTDYTCNIACIQFNLVLQFWDITIKKQEAEDLRLIPNCNQMEIDLFQHAGLIQIIMSWTFFYKTSVYTCKHKACRVLIKLSSDNRIKHNKSQGHLTSRSYPWLLQVLDPVTYPWPFQVLEPWFQTAQFVPHDQGTHHKGLSLTM